MKVREATEVEKETGVSNILRKAAPVLVVLFCVIVFSASACPASGGLANDPSSSSDSSAVQPVQEASTSEPTVSEPAGIHGSVDREAEGLHLGSRLPLFSGLPFLGILLSIALFPLVAPKFWNHNYAKISLFWAAVFAIPFLFAFKGIAFYQIIHIYLVDYIPFIILLLGLFTVSGGILVRGRLVGTPSVNTLLLVVGTILASWMGTTGASMLMIRPLLRANRARKHKAHVFVFVIFLISNIGGAITPLGDPPLFLGFLHGVPFFWTFNLLPQMLLAAGIILLVFYFVDSFFYRRENRDAIQHALADAERGGLRVDGAHNFIFLAGIVGAVLLSGVWRPGSFSFLGVPLAIQNEVRDLVILVMGALSLATTARNVREGNKFTWFAIKEVACLFAGIFMTILPLLVILRAGEKGSMAFIIRAINQPAHYFWASGVMSSFLDNAPTYLTFFNMALGRLQIPEGNVGGILSGALNVNGGSQLVLYVKAVSAGAVFFGANTYIGNAPNFMVRSIAEEHHVKMPSFFGYMLWSIGILIPTFILITFIFFR